MKARVEYSAAFTKAINHLKRRYRRIVDDLLPLVEQLQAGETPGDRVQNVAPYIVYKARLKNRDSKRGKSGGYRTIYYIRDEESILMVSIYPKSERADITPQEILDIIEASKQQK